MYENKAVQFEQQKHSYTRSTLFTGEKRVIAAHLDFPAVTAWPSLCSDELFDNFKSSDTWNVELIHGHMKGALPQCETHHFG